MAAGRNIPGRKRGAYLGEKLVGFRMSPEKYEELKRVAAMARKTVAQIINEALDVRLGWHEELFDKSSSKFDRPSFKTPAKKAKKKK